MAWAQRFELRKSRGASHQHRMEGRTVHVLRSTFIHSPAVLPWPWASGSQSPICQPPWGQPPSTAPVSAWPRASAPPRGSISDRVALPAASLPWAPASLVDCNHSFPSEHLP